MQKREVAKYVIKYAKSYNACQPNAVGWNFGISEMSVKVIKIFEKHAPIKLQFRHIIVSFTRNEAYVSC